MGKNFLDNITASIDQTLSGVGFADPERDYLSKFAPNAIEFVTSPEYWNATKTHEFPVQWQLIRDLFNLRCPNDGCNDQSPEAKLCFGKSKETLQAETLLVWSDFDNDFKCPKCGNTLTSFMTEGIFTHWLELLCISGMRSGKSFLGAHIGGYIEHVLRVYGVRGGRHAIPDLFRQSQGETFDITFAASTATQAKETIHAKWRSLRSTSPYFNRAIAWLRAEEAKQMGMHDSWTYKELEDTIYDGYLQIRLGRSASNSGSLAGRTRIFASIDELSRLSVSESKTSAQEMYRVLNQSLKTVRGAVRRADIPFFFGLMLNVTSPIAIDDYAMSLYAQHQAGELPRTLAWKGATWEFNSNLDESDFEAEKLKDFQGFMRDFGANPPNASSPLIQDPIRFWKSIDSTRKPLCRFVPTYKTDKTGKDYIGAAVIDVPYDWTNMHYIFCDAGQTFDSFGVVCAHPEYIMENHYQSLPENHARMAPPMPEEGMHVSKLPVHPDSPMAQGYAPDNGRSHPINSPMTDMNPGKLITVIDFCCRIVPQKNREIHFASLIEIIKELHKKWKIATVAFDQWQSVNMIQEIRDLGITSNKVKLKSDDFMAFVMQAYNDTISLLPPDAEDNICLTESGTLQAPMEEELMAAETVGLIELLKLERSPDLRKVLAPKKGTVRGRGSDDIARCIVGVNLLIKDSVVNNLDSGRRRDLRKRLNATGGGLMPTLFRTGK